MLRNRVALIGGGHAHALVLRKWAMQPRPNTELLLISPVEQAAYSGMLPGFVSGHYSAPSMHIDLRRLAQAAGAVFVHAQVEGLDPTRRQILLASRPPLTFDVASVNVGSTPGADLVPGASVHAVPVKPVPNFIHHWQQLVQQSQTTQRPLRIIIVGGGAGGVELALAMAYRLGTKASICLVHGGTKLVSSHNPIVQARLTQELKSKHIELIISDKAVHVSPETLHLASGRTRSFDALYWTTHAVAPSWFRNTKLTLTDTGFLAIDDTLACQGHSNIFAAGDCATVVGQERPKSGVFAVRQASTLYTNITNSLHGTPLQRLRLQRQYLSLIATGDKRAIASRGPFTASGTWVWRWKNHIDQNFMRQFSELKSSSPMTALPTEEMRCFGCGSKIGSQALTEALEQLARDYPDVITAKDIPWGISAHEDGSLWSIRNETNLLQSIDYLPALVTDPYIAGQITTNHVASDILVKGARLHSVLLLAILPSSTLHLSQDHLLQLLAGVASQLKLLGAVLIGGHTAEGERLAIGMTANGIAPARPISKSTSRVDDVLILTKPLGTGILFAGMQRQLTRAEAINAAIASMLRSPKNLVEVFSKFDIHAATDVTGFGLLGHLKEMLTPGSIGATLDSAAIPLLHDAQNLAQQGVQSSLFPANFAAVRDLVSNQGPDDWRLWCDPQTSGGWLITVAAHAALGALAEIRSHGFLEASVIGRIKSHKLGEPLISIQ